MDAADAAHPDDRNPTAPEPRLLVHADEPAMPAERKVVVEGAANGSTVELAAQMIAEIADWLPGRELHLYADGAYASLVGADLPRTVVTSRLRRDAALYEPAPPRTGKRGRPRTKGDRLPTPPELAAAATDWVDADIDLRAHLATHPAAGDAFSTPNCLVKITTGFDCPGCGGTRAFWYLMHGNVAAAARNHLVAVFAAPFLVYMYIAWAGRQAFGWTLPMLRIGPKTISVFLAVWAVFSIARNLPWAPFTWFYV